MRTRLARPHCPAATPLASGPNPVAAIVIMVF
jgi:hypothetical protein